MANRATRFLEQDGLTPGPGAYQLRKIEVNGKSKKPVPPESRVSAIYVIIVIYCILDR